MDDTTKETAGTDKQPAKETQLIPLADRARLSDRGTKEPASTPILKDWASI